MDWLGSDHMGTPTDAHATTGGCVLCAWSVSRGYKRIREWEFSSLVGKFVVEEELEVSL
jgi:hypothetical protein